MIPFGRGHEGQVFPALAREVVRHALERVQERIARFRVGQRPAAGPQPLGQGLLLPCELGQEGLVGPAGAPASERVSRMRRRSIGSRSAHASFSEAVR